MNLTKHRWVLFGTRPVSLLERALRNRGYIRAGLSHVVAISKKGLTKIYVDALEWKRLEQKYRLLLVKGNTNEFTLYKKRLGEAKKFIRFFKKNTALNYGDLNALFILYERITEGIIYTHFLENQVDTVPGLRKYMRPVGKLHEGLKQVIDRLYEEFSKKKGNKRKGWLLPQELLQGKRVGPEIIKKREENYFIYNRKHSMILTQGETAKKNTRQFEQSLHVEQTAKGIEEIHGKSASPGKVKGIVSVVADWRLVPGRKIQILVTPMTDTRTVQYLRRMRAIVTDEGGLTCHAAVVSREFGIPCVVGTKIATKVLKDGDLVEVNANQGTVRILKRHGRK